MAVIEIKAEPTRKDLVVFALLCLAGMPLLGLVLGRMGDGPLVLAGIATACLGLSLALNSERPRRAQLAGLALPVVLAGAWAATAALPGGARIVLAVLSAAGAAAGVATLASPAIGTRLYHAWMLAVLPIGWTVSHILLSVAFFGVVMPIGLAMRALGRDPLQRRFDPGAATYWNERERVTDPRRYMRQF